VFSSFLGFFYLKYTTFLFYKHHKEEKNGYQTEYLTVVHRKQHQPIPDNMNVSVLPSKN